MRPTIWFLILGFLPMQFAQADSPGETQAPAVIIQQLEPDFEAADLAQPGVEVRSLDDLYSSADAEAGVPAPRTRNALFLRAGIAEDVTGMDAESRDRLYIRAGALKLEILAQRYPRMDRSKLRRLQELVAGDSQ